MHLSFLAAFFALIAIVRYTQHPRAAYLINTESSQLASPRKAAKDVHTHRFGDIEPEPRYHRLACDAHRDLLHRLSRQRCFSHQNNWRQRPCRLTERRSSSRFCQVEEMLKFLSQVREITETIINNNIHGTTVTVTSCSATPT